MNSFGKGGSAAAHGDLQEGLPPEKDRKLENAATFTR